MIAQFDNQRVSSFLLYLDYWVQKQGAAFYTVSSLLYPVKAPVNGLYAYAAPFKQLCNDTSITGATVLTGIFLNNNLITVGQSGLVAINHYQGAAYFSGELPKTAVLSGTYSVKEFNIELTDQTEYKLLFDTTYVPAAKYNQTLSGLPLDTKTSPTIFLKINDTENKPFAFCGLDDNSLSCRAIVIADNEFQRVAVTNILKNLNLKNIKIVTGLPLTFDGAYTGSLYNYESVGADTTYTSIIMSARSSRIPQRGEFANISRNMSFVDFEVSTPMAHA